MKFKKILLPAITLLAVMCSGLISNTATSIDGYFIDNTDLKDNFDSKTIDSTKWTTNEVDSEIENYSLRFHPTKYEWVDQLTLGAENTKFSKSFVIEADLTSNDTKAEWQAFSFGLSDKSLKFSDASFALIFYPSYLEDTSLTALVANRDKSGYLETVSKYLYATPFDKANVYRRLRITVNIIDSKSSTVFYDILDLEGNPLKTHAEKDIYNVNASLAGYIGLNNSGVNTIFKNFKVYDLESGNTLYEDDFSKSSIQYATEGEGVWSTSTFSKDDVVLGPLAGAKLKNGSSSLVSNTRFDKEESSNIDTLFTQQLTVKYASMSRNSFTCLEIAKASQSENGYLFGLKKNENGFGYSLVSFDKNMNCMGIAYSEVDAKGSIVNLTLKAYFDNTIEFYSDELNLKVSVNDVNGYYGFKNISLDGKECEGPVCDNYSMVRTRDEGTEADDVGMNFDGTREVTLGQLQLKQFFVPKTEWQFTSSSDFSLATYEDTGIPGLAPNGYAIFDNCTNMTLFGSKQKYTNYVVRFDVQILTKLASLKEASGFALEFGLNKYGTYYDNVQSLGLYNTLSNDGPISLAMAKHAQSIYGGTTVTFPVEGEEGKYINFFDKRGGEYPTLNVMYVVKDGYVSMFFKYADEPEEMLLKPRMIVKAENSTAGYCCVVGTEGITFALDNYSISNLDYVEKEVEYTPYSASEYQITTRKDFRVENANTSGLTLSNAELCKKSVEIKDGGSIKTVGSLLNGLTRVRFNSLEERAEFKYGDASISFVDDNLGKRVEAKDGSGVQKFELSKDFVFSNSVVEVQRVNGTFTVSLASGNRPLSSIKDTTFVISLAPTTLYSNLEIVSSGVTRISTFTLVNYDSHVIIATRNFDPEKDTIVSWVEKQSIQEKEAENKKGCGGSIVGASIVVTVLALITCALLLLRRKENA